MAVIDLPFEIPWIFDSLFRRNFLLIYKEYIDKR